MRCCLPNGAVLNFKNQKAFKILQIIGQGASSVVYQALCLNTNTEVLLKEYNPRRVAMYRDEKGFLCLDSAKDQQLFDEGTKQFEAAYETQRIFLNDPDLKNSTSHIQEIHSGYGTWFIEMHYFSGKSYEKVQEKSLNDLLRRMRAISQVIYYYHNKGYLHLDLKPDNIFVLPETCDMVTFFDFDSVIKKEDLLKEDTRLAYTRSWAPPELTNPERTREIAEYTDIYSLGMVLFSKIMGRLPNPDEHRVTAKYSFNTTTGLLADASDNVLNLLENVFHHTICRSPQNRWDNVADLIAALNEIISVNYSANFTTNKKRKNPESGNRFSKAVRFFALIVRWYISAAFLVSGISVLTIDNIATGILWFAGGILLCPMLLKKVKTSIKTTVAIILFIIGSMLM